MPDHDYSYKLKTVVEAILAKKELGTFVEYWNLGNELIKVFRYGHTTPVQKAVM